MQEGLTRLWRGTNASLALAVPSVSSLLTVIIWLLYTGYYIQSLYRSYMGP